MGNWKEENEDIEMTIAAQVTAAEHGPELAATAQRRPIDVSTAQEEKPKKRARLAYAFSVLEHFSKFDFVCI